MSATQKPKRKRTLLYVLLGVLGLLIVAAAVKARQKPKGEEVTAEAVQRRTINETVSASGKIFAETEVKISPEVSGEIIALYVKVGDSVTVGQVLAKIRPDEYQSAVQRGEAAVSSARAQREISSTSVAGSAAQIEQLNADRTRAAAQLEVARQTHQRNEKLYQDGVISKADFEASVSNLRSAESGLAAADAALKSAQSNLAGTRENVRVSEYGITSARANLQELRTNLQKTIVVAPISGIISKLDVKKGEKVVGAIQMTGTEMMRIVNLHAMEAQVEVSESDILKLALGDDADVEVDAYLGRKFKGKVVEIPSSPSNASALAGATLNTDAVTNYIVKVRLDPASYADLTEGGRRKPFLPGMSASVDIYTRTAENVVSVPLAAVSARDKDEGKKDDKPKEAPADANKAEKEKEEDAEIKEIVFVVSGDTVAVREVQIGIQDNDFIEIKTGLQEGEIIVTGPYAAISRKLKGGSRIRIVDKDNDENKKKGVKVEID